MNKRIRPLVLVLAAGILLYAVWYFGLSGRGDQKGNQNIGSTNAPVPIQWTTYDVPDNFTIQIPSRWSLLDCDDDMLIYFTPMPVACGAGLEAIAIRQVSDQTVASRLEYWRALIANPATADVGVSGQPATEISGRLLGADNTATDRSQRVIIVPDGSSVWELSTTLPAEADVFAHVTSSFTFNRPN